MVVMVVVVVVMVVVMVVVLVPVVVMVVVMIRVHACSFRAGHTVKCERADHRDGEPKSDHLLEERAS